jgi:DNA polymerase III epsilon subunit-like protein
MAWRSNETRRNLLTALGYDVVGSELVHTPNDNIIILADVETSGLDYVKDRVIQISALRCKYNPETKTLDLLETFDQYIKPELTVINKDGTTSIIHEVEPKITELTGITNEMLAEAPLEKDVFPKIAAFIGNAPIFVAYNSNFDRQFITNMYIRHGEPFKIEAEHELDALKMARDLVSKEEAPKIEDKDGKLKPTYKLGKIAELYGVDKLPGEEAGAFHSSLFDTKVMRQLVNVFINEYIEKIEEELKKHQ